MEKHTFRIEYSKPKCSYNNATVIAVDIQEAINMLKAKDAEIKIVSVKLIEGLTII